MKKLFCIVLLLAAGCGGKTYSICLVDNNQKVIVKLVKCSIVDQRYSWFRDVQGKDIFVRAPYYAIEE